MMSQRDPVAQLIVQWRINTSAFAPVNKCFCLICLPKQGRCQQRKLIGPVQGVAVDRRQHATAQARCLAQIDAGPMRRVDVQSGRNPGDGLACIARKLRVILKDQANIAAAVTQGAQRR